MAEENARDSTRDNESSDRRLECSTLRYEGGKRAIFIEVRCEALRRLQPGEEIGNHPCSLIYQFTPHESTFPLDESTFPPADKTLLFAEDALR